MMQITINQGDDLKQVLAAVGAMYGVDLAVVGGDDSLPDQDYGAVKPRHG